MSFRAMNWAAECRTGSSTRKLILMSLADRANDDGVCFPSTDKIAYDCELTRECVSRNIRAMEKDGLLSTEKRRNQGTFSSNVYKLSMKPPCDLGSQGHVILKPSPCDPEAVHHVIDDHTNHKKNHKKEPIGVSPLEISAGMLGLREEEENEFRSLKVSSSKSENDNLLNLIASLFEGMRPERKLLFISWFKYRGSRKIFFSTPRGVKSFMTEANNKFPSDPKLKRSIEFSMNKEYKGIYANPEEVVVRRKICTEAIEGSSVKGTVYFMDKPVSTGGFESTTVSADELKQKIKDGEWENLGRYSQWKKDHQSRAA